MNQLFTPCIVQTIVICCTVIVIALVLLSGYRIKKQQEQSWQGYIFISSILTILAVIILSYIFYGDRNVLDFVSLSSALISIILAIITIIYSFYSNSRSSGQIETLNKAAESVKKATLSYSDSAESLQENISKIITVVNRVDEKTDRLIGMTFAPVSGTSGRANNHLVDFDLDAYIKGYVDLVSPIGVMALYACIKSKDSNKVWNLDLFTNNENQFYCSGFLISTTSAGFITLTIDFNTGNVTVSEYIEKVKEQVLLRIGSSVFTEDLINIKKNIDHYFGDIE